MRRGAICLLLIFTLLLLVVLPERAVPVLAYRVALTASMGLGSSTSGVQSTSTLRVDLRRGTDSDEFVVREACVEALQLLELEFGFVPDQPIRVIVDEVPAGTLGYYTFGRVVLAPPSVSLEEARGPALHELTHYAIDLITYGNYPGWFSEGLALYMELKHQGVRWTGDGRHGGVIAYGKLDSYLAHSLYYKDAYGQALNMVEYMYSRGGSESIMKVLAGLRQGQSFERLLLSVYGLSVDSLLEEWYHWGKAG